MEVFCIRRAGSYDDTMHSFYIDNSILNNTEQFSANEISGGDLYNFKLPVGVFRYNSQNDATYLTVFGKNNFQGCLVWYQGETRYAKPTSDMNPNAIGTSFGVQKSPTYGDAIPFFNNAIDASNYSMGLPYNADNWVGGKPLTPPYNWQSVPGISGKNGILSLVTLDSEAINDGEAVTGAAISVFEQNPASGNNVKDIVDGNTPLIPSAVDVTAAFIISNPLVGELASRILAAKKGSIPESIEDADKTVSIPANASNATMPDLDENSQYYFTIFVTDSDGNIAVSDPKDIQTSHSEGYNFDYTGEIVEWTAPKTGIYSLETWGAQGENATDGTNSARGGYGAYAYGEVFLNAGDKLYINVGGQNGYNGGGNGIICLSQIVIDNQIVNLMQVNDFSFIPSDLAGSTITGFNERRIFYTDDVTSDEVPSWLDSNGDLIIEVGTSIDYTNKDLQIKDNTTDLFIRCPDDRGNNSQSGITIRIGDNIILSGLRHEKTGNATRKMYMGVILDYGNACGYILLYGKYYNPQNGVYNNVVWISGGKYNGIDIVYEAFKDAQP